MKSIYFTIIIMFVLGFLSSCNKLDRYPYNAIELSKSFTNIKDAKTWNNGLYAQLRARAYGIYTFSTDVQADQLNATLDYGNRNGAPHRWDFLADDYTIRDIWSGYYSAIADLNIIINGYTKITVSTDADKALLDRYTGDAYLARAYYYHQLILRWSKAYNPSSAASDLGVPLILTYDPEHKPTRATVKEVYDQIIADINKSKSLLANTTGTKGATSFNKDVAIALEARVKLYMQDMTGAATAANQLISSGTYPLLTTQSDLSKMWVNDLGTEVIFQCFTKAPSELANTNSIYLGYNPTSKKYTPDFIPSKWVLDMYSATDYRKNVYFANLPTYIQGTDYTNIYLVNKYPGNPILFTTASTNYQQSPKLFRIAEMYLILAESTSSSNAANSLTALNTLRVARGLPQLVGLTGPELMQAIKDERFRELAFEGFRLDDLKRWGEGVNRHDPQNSNLIVTNPTNTYYQLTKQPSDNKFVWGLPTNDITINSNLVQNQGW